MMVSNVLKQKVLEKNPIKITLKKINSLLMYMVNNLCAYTSKYYEK